MVQAYFGTLTWRKRLELVLNLIVFSALASEYERKPEICRLLPSHKDVSEDSGAVIGCLINESTQNCGAQSFPFFGV